MKRLISTPYGMTALDGVGSDRDNFVNATVFDQDGRAVCDEMWRSGQDERLAAFLARVSGLSAGEAERLESELLCECLAEWRQRGGPEEDAQLARDFTRWVGAVLLGVLAVGSSATVGALWVARLIKGRMQRSE